MQKQPRLRRTSRAIRVTECQHGLGVFAKRSFKPYDIIGEITGTVVEDAEYGSDYCMDLGGDFTLEPDAPFRFVNHSCDPNCGLYPSSNWNEKTHVLEHVMWLKSIAPIMKGQELTIDYGWPAWAAIPCNCGTQLCRGIIVSKKHSDEVKGMPAS